MSLPGISDHNLITMTLSLPIETKKPIKKLIRDYNRGDYHTINNELRDFFPVFCANYEIKSVNENWVIFKNFLNQLVNTYVPCVLVKTDNNHPWYNKILKRLANKKKRLFRKAKKITRMMVGTTTTYVHRNIYAR